MQKKIKILYFSSLREDFGLSEEYVSYSENISTLSNLKNYLKNRGNIWMEKLAEDQPFRVAINQELIEGNVNINENDEIAFFPPVTGG